MGLDIVRQLVRRVAEMAQWTPTYLSQVAMLPKMLEHDRRQTGWDLPIFDD